MASTGQGNVPNQHAESGHKSHNPVKRGVGEAGNMVGAVSKGLEVGGHKNPVSGIVGSVSDGLKTGAGEHPDRHSDRK